MLQAFVRTPAIDLSPCELTHLEREPIDGVGARREHAAYCAALTRLGVGVTNLPAPSTQPDAVFIEDAAIVLDEIAVLPTLGAPSRRVETDQVAAALAPLRQLEQLNAGTLDGGDVLRVDDMLYVGLSTRTTHAALRALAHLVLPHGMSVKAVEVSGALHLKTACTYAGDGVLVAHRPSINLERVRGFEVIDVPPDEPQGANVVRVGERVLVDRSAPRTAELLAARGFDPLPLDLRELGKAEAGLSCLGLFVAD